MQNVRPYHQLDIFQVVQAVVLPNDAMTTKALNLVPDEFYLIPMHDVKNETIPVHVFHEF